MEKNHYLGEILPTPKRASYGKGHVAFVPGERETGACILLGTAAPLPHQTAAEELRDYLAGLTEAAGHLPILMERDPAWRAYGTVIVLGTLASSRLVRELVRQQRWKLSATQPGKEGYLIRFGNVTAAGRHLSRFGRDRTPNTEHLTSKGNQSGDFGLRCSVLDVGCSVILCAGSDDRGAYFAAQSLMQLCQGQGNRVVVREARVDDWPTFAYRAMFCNDVAAARRVASWKMNSFDIVYSQFGERWRNPDGPCRKLVADLGHEAARRGLNATPYVNPLFVNTAHFPAPRLKRLYTPGPAWQRICISSERDIQALYRTFRLGLDRGSRIINLTLDDFSYGNGSYYLLSYAADRKKFNNSIGRAHAYLSRRIYALMKRDYPEARLFVCPAYYYNFGGVWLPYAEEYLRELGTLPKDIAIQWTGPAMRSPHIDRKDVNYFAQLIRRRPCLWDNTPYALHDPCDYLFDPFAANYFADLPAWLDYRMHSNGSSSGVIARVSVIQIACYMWNPAAYDSAAVLRKAIAVAAGQGLVQALLAFRDGYFRLHDAYPCLHSAPRDAVIDQWGYRRMQAGLAEFQRLMARIEKACDNQELVQSLKQKYFDPLMKKAAAFKARRWVKAKLQRRLPAGLELRAESFVGGAWSTYPGSEQNRVVYSRQNPCHRMTAQFVLPRRPARDVLLDVRGRDSLDKNGRPTPIRIQLNGRTVFEGPGNYNRPETLSTFVVISYSVPAGWLRKGWNILSIANRDNLHIGGNPNFKVAWVRLQGLD